MSNQKYDGYPPPATPQYVPSQGYLDSLNSNSATEKTKNYNAISAFALVTHQFFTVIIVLIIVLSSFFDIYLLEINKDNTGIINIIEFNKPRIETLDESSTLLIVIALFATVSIIALTSAFINSIIGLIISFEYKIIGLLVFITSGLSIMGFVFFVTELTDLSTIITLT